MCSRVFSAALGAGIIMMMMMASIAGCLCVLSTLNVLSTLHEVETITISVLEKRTLGYSEVE